METGPTIVIIQALVMLINGGIIVVSQYSYSIGTPFMPSPRATRTITQKLMLASIFEHRPTLRGPLTDGELAVEAEAGSTIVAHTHACGRYLGA